MGWNVEFKSDIGMFRILNNGDFSGNVRKYAINGGMAVTNAEDGYKRVIAVTSPTGELAYGEIPLYQTKTLFGFALKQNGESTGKYVVCRATCTTLSDTSGINRGYMIDWFIFDETNNTYTRLTDRGVDVSLVQLGSIQWLDTKCSCVFKVEKSFYNNIEQTMIYGGLYLKASESNYGSSEWMQVIGLRGIGVISHLGNYDQLVIGGKLSSPEYGPASEPGGGYIPGGGELPGGRPSKTPSFDNTSDKIEISTKPTLSAIKSKFLHAYVVNEQSLEYIGDALFPQPVFQQPDLITAMGELGQIIFFNKQVDYMLDLLILPIDVPHGDWEPLNVGGRQLSTVIEGTTKFINGQPATDCYVDVTCGGISIDEYWVNFLDFAGTKVKLFLPYVGYIDIQPEYVIGGRLYVDYRFNILDGSFMAYVRSDSGYSELEESLICQYAGVAAVHIPLQSKDYSAKISGLISAIGTVGAGAISGGIGAASAAGATANAANTIVQKPGTAHANGYNASSSFLSHRTPYLIIERQWSQFSEKYPEEVGMPSNIMCRLGDLQGLVKSANAHLDVIPASIEGKEKISQLLADGIIL